MRRSPPLSQLAELIREVIARGGHLEISAVGSSMSPAILPGEGLVLSPLRAGEPRPGQVALCSRAGRLIAHRVVERSENRLVTRGDACEVDDPVVAGEEVLAVVREVRRSPRARTKRALRALWATATAAARPGRR